MSGVSFLFLGDISLNDDYVEHYGAGRNPFEKLLPFLSTADFVVGNLECIAKGDQGENFLKRPRLTTTVEALHYLNNLNVNLVSLAHNHIFDHLEDGYIKTTKFLEKNKIQYLGASLNGDELGKPVILSKEDVMIGFLNYVTGDTNPNTPPDTKIHLNIFDFKNVIADIQKLKQKVDHVVLLLHWGGRVEGGLYPDFDQPQIARDLIDAGADLIIGHHSHTIQPYEIYKGKYIFYSLGNFCFSNFTFEGVKYIMPKRRKYVIIPEVNFSKTEYNVINTYWLNKGSEYLAKPLYKYRMLIRSFLFYTHKYKGFWNLYFFKHRKINPVVFYFLRNDISLSRKVKNLKWSKIRKQIKK